MKKKYMMPGLVFSALLLLSGCNEKPMEAQIGYQAGALANTVLSAEFQERFQKDTLRLFRATYVDNISIDGIDIGGLTKEEGEKKVREEKEKLLAQTKLHFVDGEKEMVKTFGEFGFGYDYGSAFEEAWNYGKKGSIQQRRQEISYMESHGKDIPLKVKEDSKVQEKALKELKDYVEVQPKDSDVKFENDQFVVGKPTDGHLIDMGAFQQEIEKVFSAYKETERDLIEKAVKERDAKKKLATENLEGGKPDTNSEIVEEPEEEKKEKDKKTVEAAGQVPKVQELTGPEIPNAIKDVTIQLPMKDVAVRRIDVDSLNKNLGVIGSSSTYYGSSTAGRANNVEVAAKVLNNIVVLPGETFSILSYLGEMTADMGYQDAAIIKNGKFVDGMAGGVCQVSTTLYQAGVKSDMKIVERYQHSLPVGYTSTALDASILYPYADMKFQNTFDFPVLIRSSANGTNLYFEILGDTSKKNYGISLSSEVTERFEKPVKRVENKNLAPGEERVVEKGMSGYKSVSYEYNEKTGERTVLNQDYYKPMEEIIEYGPEKPKPAEPGPDKQEDLIPVPEDQNPQQDN